MSLRSRPSQRTRPLSAIYLGKDSSGDLPNDNLAHPPGRPALPSPPHTNSNSSGAGSTGYSGGASIARPGSPSSASQMAASLRQRERAKYSPPRTNFSNEPHYVDDDDEDDDVDSRINDFQSRGSEEEETTARLSDDRRSEGSSRSAMSRRSLSMSASGADALYRAKSLADRNRAVLDKLAAVTSPRGARFSATPSRNGTHGVVSSRDNSPLMPLPPRHNDSSPIPHPTFSASTSSLVSFTRSRNELKFVSGSDTERERLSSSEELEELSSTPTYSSRRTQAHTDGKDSVRRRMGSAPSPPRSLALRDGLDPPSISRGTRQSALESDDEFDADHTSSRLTSRKSTTRRAPLPTEFFDAGGSTRDDDDTPRSEVSSSEIERGYRERLPPVGDGDGDDEPPTPTRPSLSHAESSRSGKSTARRPSTVRDPSTRANHTRWASEASADSSTTERPRYRIRGNSAESKLTGFNPGVRSVVTEGLRAAGLSPSPRKEVNFTTTSRKIAGARQSLPNDSGTIREEHRRPYSSRDNPPRDVEPDRNLDAERTHGGTRFQQNIRSAMGGSVTPSRPSTSAGMYATPSPFAQRGSPSPYAPRQPRNGSPLDRQPQYEERPYSRATALNASLNSSASSATARNHSDILLDAFNMLEGHISRLPLSSSTYADECIRSAQSLVDNTRSLNARLRAATSSALEEHIEAEVNAPAASSREAEEVMLNMANVWNGVGGEFRDNLKLSDELVRTLTGFLLAFGKIIREMPGPSASTVSLPLMNDGGSTRRPGSVGSNDDLPLSSFRSGSRPRQSLDLPSRDREIWDSVDGRRSAGSRNSGDGRRSLDGRRSMDPARASSAADHHVRAQTSMSFVRQSAGRDTPPGSSSQNHSRRPGVFSALSTRKFFTSTRRIAPSPSPSPSTSVETYVGGRASLDDSMDTLSPSPAGRFSSMRQNSNSSSSSRGEGPSSRPILPVRSSADTIQPPRRSPHKLNGSGGGGRRNKSFAMSNATVRGMSIFPTGSAPTTQLTTSSPGLPANTELAQSPVSTSLQRTLSFANSYSSQEREPRKRTLSATSDTYAVGEMSPGATVSAADLKAIRANGNGTGKPRVSLDSWSGTAKGSEREREDSGRRKSLTGLFR